MADRESLHITEIGPVVLVTESYSGSPTGYYVCTSFSLNMAIGQIPVANVLLGFGQSIESRTGNHGQSAEELFYDVLSRTGSVYNGMVRCKLYEATPGLSNISSVAKHGTLIFSGVITNGSLVYQASSVRTAKMMRLTCYSSAIALYTMPISELTLTTGTAALAAAYGVETHSTEAMTSDATLSPVMSAYENLQSIGLPGYSVSGDLASKVAALLACVMYAHSADGQPWQLTGMDKHIPVYYNNIMSCLCSDWAVSESVVTDLYGSAVNGSNTPGYTFDKLLLEEFTGAYGSGTLFQLMSSVLCSNEYMLELVPRFGGDFKMELKPSSAWLSSSPSIALEKRAITGIDSAYSPISSIHVPDVYVVSYDELSSDCAGDSSALAAYTRGVYAKDPIVRDAFASALSATGTGSSSVLSSYLYKVRSYKAPKWLRPSIWNTPQGTGQNLVSTLRPQQLSGAVAGQGSTYLPSQAASLANRIAAALFSYNYGSQDRCVVSVTPEVRFGKNGTVCLENSIGELIRLDMSDDEDSPMNMTGMLDSLSYHYEAGADKCVVGYSITLSRTRLAADTFSLDCPLYRRIR